MINIIGYCAKSPLMSRTSEFLSFTFSPFGGSISGGETRRHLSGGCYQLHTYQAIGGKSERRRPGRGILLKSSRVRGANSQAIGGTGTQTEALITLLAGRWHSALQPERVLRRSTAAGSTTEARCCPAARGGLLGCGLGADRAATAAPASAGKPEHWLSH